MKELRHFLWPKNNGTPQSSYWLEEGMHIYYMIHFLSHRVLSRNAFIHFLFKCQIYLRESMHLCNMLKTREMQHLVWIQKYHWSHSCQKIFRFCMREIPIYCIWPWNLNQNCVYWSLRKNWINSIHHKCDADIAQFLAKWFQTSFVTSIIYYM